MGHGPFAVPQNLEYNCLVGVPGLIISRVRTDHKFDTAVSVVEQSPSGYGYSHERLFRSYGWHRVYCAAAGLAGGASPSLFRSLFFEDI